MTSLFEVQQSDRLQKPFSQIGLIVGTYPNGDKVKGVGSIVGRNDVLTASHIVYNPSKGGWIKDIDFYFGADYNGIFDRFDSEVFSYKITDGIKWRINAFMVLSESKTSTSGFTYSDASYDFAIIGLSFPIGDVLGWLNLNFESNAAQFATQVGYEIDQPGMMINKISVAYSDSSYAGHSVYYNNVAGTTVLGATSGGSPLLDAQNQVIGVKSYNTEKNSAVYGDIGFIKSDLLLWINNNDTIIQNPKALTSSLKASAGELIQIGKQAPILQGYDPDWTKMTAGSLEQFNVNGRGNGDNIIRAINVMTILDDPADGRQIDPTRLGFWIEQIEEGTLTLGDKVMRDILSGFVYGKEFSELALKRMDTNGDGINDISYTKAAVQLMYRNVLGRSWADIVNDPGANWLASEIEANRVTIVEVAERVCLGAEAINSAVSIVGTQNLTFVAFGDGFGG